MNTRPPATSCVADNKERANKTSCMADNTLPPEEPSVKQSPRGVSVET